MFQIGNSRNTKETLTVKCLQHRNVPLVAMFNKAMQNGEQFLPNVCFMLALRLKKINIL